ncbi:glycoside hydrolase family 45 protein [Sporormia fimetaria CBS 119925]|uniref:cellulase n=1 Tax=Sporormia fimetaria CBS 119925 TaxID=1340428 RepID=A0A6A6VGN7_9PLEO|nr:glycoside hydrolase family 45 protein [Sporormia fimetaria CBS 119925]
MTIPNLRNILFALQLLLVPIRAQHNVSGEAITTRFWDCCKPSCSWRGKASVSQPIQDCDINDAPHNNPNQGSGCGTGGTAYTCNNQQPWAVNDTLSYGFAGVFLTGHPETEDFWCCACYQLDFTSDPLKGKSMIVQASNSAFEVNKVNRFSLAVPGGNTTSQDACSRQYNVDQSVFGATGSGVGSLDECDRLPEQLRDACRWRFDWFQDAQYPTANFHRVACPKEITDKTKCTRNDEPAFVAGKPSASTVIAGSSLLAGVPMLLASLLLAQ